MPRSSPRCSGPCWYLRFPDAIFERTRHATPWFPAVRFLKLRRRESRERGGHCRLGRRAYLVDIGIPYLQTSPGTNLLLCSLFAVLVNAARKWVSDTTTTLVLLPLLFFASFGGGPLNAAPAKIEMGAPSYGFPVHISRSENEPPQITGYVWARQGIGLWSHSSPLDEGWVLYRTTDAPKNDVHVLKSLGLTDDEIWSSGRADHKIVQVAMADAPTVEKKAVRWVDAPASSARRELTLRQTRELGLTLHNMASSYRELKAAGEIDDQSSEAETASAIAVHIASKNKAAFSNASLNWDAILAFISKWLPIIIALFSGG
jgi:hypothetical protein